MPSLTYRYTTFFSKAYVLCLLLAFLFNQLGHGQHTPLRNLINSDLDHTEKEKKIALLVENLVSTRSDSLADCYHDLGLRWHYRNWLNNNLEPDIENAIKYTQLAIELKSEHRTVDTLSLRQSMYNLAFFLKASGSMYESIRAYHDIIALAINDEKEHYAKNNLGLVLTDIGEFSEALSQFKDAVQFSKEKENQWQLLLLSYINTSNCYATMGYIKNKDSLDRCVRLGQKLIAEKNLQSTYEHMQLKILEGNLNLELEKYNEGISTYNQIIQSNYDGEQIPEIVYNNLGFCYLKNGDTINAKANLLKAIKQNPDFSYPYENLGDLSFERKKFERGINNYQKAIQLVTNIDGLTESPLNLPEHEELELTLDKLSLLQHLTAKAKGWLKYYEHKGDQNHLKLALATFKKADELIDIIKRENTEFTSKLYWREQSSELYAKAVETCYYLNDTDEALYFMERNKALLLLEDITHEKAKAFSQLPDSLAQLDFKIKREIALSENKFKNEILSKERLDSLKQVILAKKREYRNFIKQISKKYPTYAAYKERLPIVDLPTLQDRFTTNTRTVIHFLAADSLIYGLHTTATDATLFKVDKDNFDQQLSETIQAVGSHPYNSKNDFDPISSNKVFKALFPTSIYSQIKGKSLLIIPDGALQQLPFESLVTDKELNTYLVQEIDIQYAYSTSLLNQQRTFKYEPKSNLAAFAPINFDNIDLAELVFSGMEASEITALLKGTTFSGPVATTDEFATQLQKSSIVHLATHADVSTENTGWIAFADRKLYLDEIYALKSQADMVALSACKTSAGGVNKGEGVMSIARSLFNIGTKSVLSTLWAVDEVASKTIVVNFYKQLEMGHNKSKALQMAKLDYLKNTEIKELKHPYYWAGYVVLGDNTPLSDQPTPIWLLLTAGLITACLLLFGYKKIRTNRATA
ncbi:CHAT domain-containing tetratricopeptide repeat protein [Pseudozobellia sp. WGM2]|uniref:CHAT domain-containing protein n=1 Tax=Pseudozobellia sp. WGM2 TaxID=2787625 RepID=UPI001ADF650C|nr:CHAT domain-containing tetratricopeptide repeat protein [Pseudozobellia sp. WGM2]